jgi:(2Fe-2S) ferredoxin
LSDASPFCYPPSGAMIVCGDGPELLVYSGNDDSPMWKQFTDGILVGVGATPDRVFTADTDGRVVTWRAIDGRKLEETTVDGGATGLATTADGFLAVLGTDRVTLTDPRGGGSSVPAPGVTVAAFGPNRALGIGTKDGAFQAVDGNTGRAWGSCNVGAPVTGVAWRQPGQWLVAAGQQVFLVSGDGKAVQLAIPVGGPTGALACSQDGAISAVVAGRQKIVVLEHHQNKPVGQILFQRDVNGLGFGPDEWLGMGLDNAEANRVDLVTGKICKTEAHHGRAPGRWGFKVEVDPMTVRGVVSRVRAGGKAIAEEVYRPEIEGGRSCLTTLLGCAVLALACGLCSGVGSFLYWHFYVG